MSLTVMANQGVVSSSSSSSCFTDPSTHDVFLSFRGEDTRTNFTDHLYDALIRKGINTFIDDELRRGEEISPALLKAIEGSRVSIIVFSENYASSTWCLDELVKILQCKESNNQMVIPVFFKVDPSHVRNQTGSFHDAFADHECKFCRDAMKIFSWREALRQAASLSGWHFQEGEYECKFINNIVDKISLQVLNRTYLNVAKYPVGIESCIRDVEKLLGVGGHGRCMIGIWGTSGIGKTTIAKAVYNKIAYQFEGSCFLANVRETSMQHGGLIQLQETLLHELLGGTNLKISTPDKGIKVIEQRLRCKKVLLILDDVNQLEQLHNLAGEGWFGEGSKVIITAKDKELLTQHGIELIYSVKKLDYQQALQLFSLNAFGRNEPPLDHLKLATRAIKYAQYLPLALTLLGSHLRRKSIEHWQTTIDCYEGDPYPDIQKILRISYDGLTYRVQQVFLDIACFFKGKEEDYVVQILRGYNLKFPGNCIQVLIQNAIITIEHNKILMHDLLEQMGKDIVYEESPSEPGKRSRLWFHDDVRHILTENTGTKKIKGIMVNFPQPYELHLNAKSFLGMTNLEFFINCNACLSGDIDYLPNKLKLIDWGQCQLQTLPSNFQPKELVVFNMPRSRITQLGNKFKNLEWLTSLNLRDCEFLMKIPDLSGMASLKYLELSGCTSLGEVDPSVGFLDKLVRLDLTGCYKLTSFPKRIGLKSLVSFFLSGCTRLEIFPEILEKMDSLRELRIDHTGIRELPSSMAHLTWLDTLWAYDCENLTDISSSIYELQNLTELDFGQCPKLLAFLNKVKLSGESLLLKTSSTARAHPKPEFVINRSTLSQRGPFATLHFISFLKELNLSGNNFVTLPVCISEFVNLDKLALCGCKWLQEIPDVLPPKVSWVSVADCTSLEEFSQLSRIFEHCECGALKYVDLMNCHRLCAHYGDYMAKMENIFRMRNDSQRSPFEIVLPDNGFPKWFSAEKDCLHKRDSGFKLVYEIPWNLEWEKTGLALYTVFRITETTSNYRYCFRTDYLFRFVSLRVTVRTNGVLTFSSHARPYSTNLDSTHVCLQYIPFTDTHHQLLEDGRLCRLSIEYRCDYNLKILRHGFHLVRPQVIDDLKGLNHIDNHSEVDDYDHKLESLFPDDDYRHPSAIMEVHDDANLNIHLHHQDEWLSLSTGPTNNPRKRPHGPSDIMEVGDHTNDSIDHDDQVQWLSLSLEPENLRKRRHIDIEEQNQPSTSDDNQ